MMFTTVIILCLVFVLNGLPIEDGKEQRSLKGANPELLGGGFEGDMLFPPGVDSSRGVAIAGTFRRWPNKVIPYDISAITNTNDRTTIVNAMNQLMFDVGTTIPDQPARHVCVFFRPSQPNDSEVLKIKYGNGCSASIGYGTGYEKSLNLQSVSCFRNGIIQHELTHVLGFFHEQSRPDRDSYITVHQANIDTNQLHNFQKLNWGSDVESQGFSYDYGSIMHYPRDAFTKNSQPTITPIQNNAVIGQREKLSATDIAEIRHYYKC